jgi:hypothetical protein
MTLADLPTIYDLTDPSSNLADALVYNAYDGSYVGEGTDCATLSGVMPAYIEKKRFLWGAAYALPLLAGLYGFGRSARFRNALLWAVGGYVAPLPAAGLVAFQMGPRIAGRIHVKRRSNRRVR